MNIDNLSLRDSKWMANYEALKAYIDEHHHLPPKNAPLGAKYLLNQVLCCTPHNAHFYTYLIKVRLVLYGTTSMMAICMAFFRLWRC